MRRSEIVDRVKQEAKLNAREADEAVACTFEFITNALARGESVQLIGFGSFVVRERAARTGRHPQTGEPIEVPASKHVSFKPGQKLRGEVVDAKQR